MPRQHLVEYFATFLLPRIGLVHRIEVPDGHQLQGVEDRSLIVPGVAFPDRGECSLVCLSASCVVYCFPVLIEHVQCIDVIALALAPKRYKRLENSLCRGRPQRVGDWRDLPGQQRVLRPKLTKQQVASEAPY
jgi:hypothetical protein